MLLICISHFFFACSSFYDRTNQFECASEIGTNACRESFILQNIVLWLLSCIFQQQFFRRILPLVLQNQLYYMMYFTKMLIIFFVAQKLGQHTHSFYGKENILNIVKFTAVFTESSESNRVREIDKGAGGEWKLLTKIYSVKIYVS